MPANSKLKFDLISDTHDDCWDHDVDFAKFKQSDYVVFGGDAAGGPDNLLKTIEKLSTHYKKVLFIDGNHDNHGAEPNEAANKFHDITKTLPNCHYLGKKIVMINDVAFIGANGWTDLQLFNGDKSSFEDADKAYSITRDMKTIKFNKHIAEYAKSDYDSLVLRLNKVKKFGVKKVVMCTHTLPRHECVTVFPNARTELLECFGNGLTNNLNDAIIKVWLFGHNHYAQDFVLDDTRYVSSPRGRPGDYMKKEDWRPKQIVI